MYHIVNQFYFIHPELNCTYFSTGCQPFSVTQRYIHLFSTLVRVALVLELMMHLSLLSTDRLIPLTLSFANRNNNSRQHFTPDVVP